MNDKPDHHKYKSRPGNLSEKIELTYWRPLKKGRFAKVSIDSLNHCAARSQGNARLYHCMTFPRNFLTCIPDKSQSRIDISSKKEPSSCNNNSYSAWLCGAFLYKPFSLQSLSWSTFIHLSMTTSIPTAVNRSAASRFTILSCIQKTFGLSRIASCAWGTI